MFPPELYRRKSLGFGSCSFYQQSVSTHYTVNLFISIKYITVLTAIPRSKMYKATYFYIVLSASNNNFI
jgi:hypothetical protein